MAGHADVADRLESRFLRQMEIECHMGAARLEPRDTLPERLLWILGADALEQSHDLLRLASSCRGKPDFRRRFVEYVEVADDGLLLLHARLARETRPT